MFSGSEPWLGMAREAEEFGAIAPFWCSAWQSLRLAIPRSNLRGFPAEALAEAQHPVTRSVPHSPSRPHSHYPARLFWPLRRA
jgi:hypothetical protein